MNEKFCRGCDRMLPSSAYNKSTREKGGLQSRCKDCKKRWKQENPDKVRAERERNRNYYIEYGKKYRQENAEAIREARRKYGGERQRAMHDKYRSRTEEEMLADRHRLRPEGTKKCGGCGVSMPLDEFNTSRAQADGLQSRCRGCNAIASSGYAARRVFQFWADHGIPGTCWLADAPGHVCGGPVRADHVLPVRPRGGGWNPSGYEHTVPLCDRANNQKSNTHPAEWIERLGHPLPDTQLSRAVQLVVSGECSSVVEAMGQASHMLVTQ